MFDFLKPVVIDPMAPLMVALSGTLLSFFPVMLVDMTGLSNAMSAVVLVSYAVIIILLWQGAKRYVKNAPVDKHLKHRMSYKIGDQIDIRFGDTDIKDGYYAGLLSGPEQKMYVSKRKSLAKQFAEHPDKRSTMLIDGKISEIDFIRSAIVTNDKAKRRYQATKLDNYDDRFNESTKQYQKLLSDDAGSKNNDITLTAEEEIENHVIDIMEQVEKGKMIVPERRTFITPKE